MEDEWTDMHDEDTEFIDSEPVMSFSINGIRSIIITKFEMSGNHV